jgi:hypothetical protein
MGKTSSQSKDKYNEREYARYTLRIRKDSDLYEAVQKFMNRHKNTSLNHIVTKLLIEHFEIDAVYREENEPMIFINQNHEKFYRDRMSEMANDCYHRAVVYTLGMCDDTRRNFDSIYDTKDKEINPEALNQGWQTGTSVKVTRLAFNLFNNGTPTAHEIGQKNKWEEAYDECKQYSVSDIFCCEFAPYFVEAVRVRYPEYMGE